MKKNDNELLSIGDVIETVKDPEYIGEIVNLLQDRRDTLEIILLDKRLHPVQNYEGEYKLKKIKKSVCKPFDYSKIRTGKRFVLGDIIQKKYTSGWSRYGIIVGFTHPDGLMTNSYYNGYNGTDLLECVEITRKGLRRKRNSDGGLKRFTTTKDNCNICGVDLWHRTGPKLVVN
jgi:hypothetical protein